MDADGNWDFSVDNNDPAIQALDTGDSIEFQYSVTSTNGSSTVTITVFGADEPPCFARGTLIETPFGPRPVEDLRAGQEVLTADHGVAQIKWIGSRRAGDGRTVLSDRFAPIEILPDALGPGVPSRRLVVSPLHRVLWQGPEAQLLFGEPEVLCAAKMLVNNQTIVQKAVVEVEYFHLLLDTHSLVISEGCQSESLYPGRQGLLSFGEREQEEIFSLFPHLRSFPSSYGKAVRRILRKFEAQLITPGCLVPA